MKAATPGCSGKLLVSGAAGFLGQHVVAEALRRGWDVTGLDIQAAPCLPPEKWILCTLAHSGGGIPREAAEKFDCCIHLAWVSGHENYAHTTDNIDALAASAMFVKRMLDEGCRHFVIAGSCAEYASAQNFPLDENGLIAPETLYGVCKNALFDIARHFAAQVTAARVSWARIFQLYGPGEPMRRLLPHLAATWQSGGIFYGAGCTQLRDYLHVDDVAVALVLLAERGSNGSCNICSGNPIRLSELIRRFAIYFDAEEKIVFNAKPERQGWEPPIMYGRNDKLRKLGWTQHISLDKGLRDYASQLKYYLSNLL